MADQPVDVHVFDDVMPNPKAYRKHALQKAFYSVAIGSETFHGVGFAPATLGRWITDRFQQLVPHTTFYRQSPAGQGEPNFIHTDRDMGDWTGIFYMNERPPEGDGTAFWTHKATGDIGSTVGPDRREDWRHLERWERRLMVAARFNRLLMFPAEYFHSRAIAENYGAGDEARLIQVVFGIGNLREIPVWQ